MTEKFSINIAIIIKRLLLKWSQQDESQKSTGEFQHFQYFFSVFYSSVKGSRSFPEGSMLPCFTAIELKLSRICLKNQLI